MTDQPDQQHSEPPVQPPPDGMQRGQTYRTKVINNPFTRAARFLWIVGTLELLIFSCSSGSFIWMGTLSTDQWMKMVSATEMSQQQRDVLVQFQDQLPSWSMMMGIAGLLLGVLPGLLFVCLAFAVRKAHRGAIIACMIMASAQAFVLGFITVPNLFQSITNANPVSLTVTVLLFGTPLALLIWTIRWLFPANLLARHMVVHGYRQMYQQYLESIGQGRAANTGQSSPSTGPDNEPWNKPNP